MPTSTTSIDGEVAPARCRYARFPYVLERLRSRARVLETISLLGCQPPRDSRTFATFFTRSANSGTLSTVVGEDRQVQSQTQRLLILERKPSPGTEAAPHLHRTDAAVPGARRREDPQSRKLASNRPSGTRAAPTQTNVSFYGGGSFLGSWNDFMIDSRLLPIVKFMVLERQWSTTTFNSKLLKMQPDHGRTIWSRLKDHCEQSRTHCDPGFLPVKSRISWTFMW